MKINKLAIFIIFLTLTAGCSKKGTDLEEAQKLYDKSIEQLYKSNFDTAYTLLTRIDEEFPYTEYAQSASELLVYVSYVRKEYSEVLPIIDIYVKTNPGDKRIPYLLYIKALSFYKQIKSYKKDKEILMEFREIVKTMQEKFPESVYTKDLNLKYDYIINTLNLGELDIAIQYHKAGNCTSAIPRYLNLLEWNDPNYAPTIRFNLYSCFTMLGNYKKAEYFKNYP
jgi:outer membrane protein assembly factor BamD